MTEVSDFEITGRDLRVGMGIGGWDMEWTVTHKLSGTSLIYQTHGHSPEQRRARSEALALLTMFVDTHYPREEVMPIEPNGSAEGPRDIGPGDQAVAGAAQGAFLQPPDVAELVGALQKIAAQKKTTELDTEYEVECADFEGGYDAIIDVARAALNREAGWMEGLISDARLECEALCLRFLAGETSEKEVVDTLRKVARDAERLAVLLREAKGKAPYIVAEEWAERMRHLDDGVTPAAGFVIPFDDAASRHIEALMADNARLRDALERVVDEYDLQMYGPAVASIDVARAALTGKETK